MLTSPLYRSFGTKVIEEALCSQMLYIPAETGMLSGDLSPIDLHKWWTSRKKHINSQYRWLGQAIWDAIFKYSLHKVYADVHFLHSTNISMRKSPFLLCAIFRPNSLPYNAELQNSSLISLNSELKQTNYTKKPLLFECWNEKSKSIESHYLSLWNMVR
jgi:hypothetical protein